MMIALVAISHVFISHFAVGGGLFLVLAEHIARKKADEGLLEYLRRLTKVFVLVTTVFGALSGVGIWVTIGLVHPAATSELIHNFVWGWATEWDFFVIEIVAVLLYYYTWGRVSERTHLAFGWMYFGAAWMSLAIITAIVAFMLTPGRWLQTRSFWDGFFNPTYLPSVVLRTGMALLFASLFALLVASTLKEERTKVEAAKISSGFAAAGAGLMLVGGLWWALAVPPGPRSLFLGGSAVMSLLFLVFLGSAGLAALGALGSRLAPKQVGVFGALGLLLLGFSAIGGFEFVREGIRKPYVIYGFMYSNGVFVDEVGKLRREGILSKAKWIDRVQFKDAPLGEKVFQAQCRMCHELEGYNALKPLVAHMSRQQLLAAVSHPELLKPYMPPFAGTEEEARALAGWLYEITGGDKARGAFKLASAREPESPGGSLVKRFCYCHTWDGSANPLKPKVEGMSPDSLLTSILNLPEVNPAMPPFRGSREDAEALAQEILKRLGR